MSQSKAIRVLCVDDHAFLAEGLSSRLQKEPGMKFVGCLPTADDVVEEVRRTEADIVLLDIEMPGMDAFEAIETLRSCCPEVKTILLSAYVRDHYIGEAYRTGAWGYLSKGDSPDDIIEGIRRVSRDQPAFSPAVTERLLPTAGLERKREAPLAARSRADLLTSREKQVLRMIAGGLSRQVIAEQLCRSPMTVDNHRKSIMKKLGIHDRVELVRYAIAEGLTEL